MLQFAAVSAVVLPLLPDRGYGPYEALNPFHIWLMVVLISGVSLAGYIAWRLTRDRKGILITGLLGGLVSSTATSLVYARHAQRGDRGRKQRRPEIHARTRTADEGRLADGRRCRPMGARRTGVLTSWKRGSGRCVSLQLVVSARFSDRQTIPPDLKTL